MIARADFDRIVDILRQKGFADDDIAWSEGCKPPENADEFALEVVYVICNSGMNNKVARGIYERCRFLLRSGKTVKGNILGKSGKAAAIDQIWRDRAELYARYMTRSTDERRLAFLADLPWIGGITKFHLAKNFGVDCVKPDVHLQRLAAWHRTTPQALCDALAKETGLKSRTIDVLLWRACAEGVMNSHTGQIKAAA